jgi:hypothetical protein
LVPRHTPQPAHDIKGEVKGRQTHRIEEVTEGRIHKDSENGRDEGVKEELERVRLKKHASNCYDDQDGGLREGPSVDILWINTKSDLSCYTCDTTY